MSDRRFKIFLSHIHEESALAGSFKKELEKLYLGAIDIFVSSDEEGISGGDRWLQVIEDRLKQSELVFVLVSLESIKRPWINFEAGGAWFLQKKVIPLCILGMTPNSLPEPLHSLQSRNLQDKDELIKILYDISKSAGLRIPEVSIDELYNAIFASVAELPSVKESSSQTQEQSIDEESERGLIEGEQAAKELAGIASKIVLDINKTAASVNGKVDKIGGPLGRKSAGQIASSLSAGSTRIEGLLPHFEENVAKEYFESSVRHWLSILYSKRPSLVDAQRPS